MKTVLLALVILAAILIIVAGVWVTVALIKAITPSRRPDINSFKD